MDCLYTVIVMCVLVYTRMLPDIIEEGLRERSKGKDCCDSLRGRFCSIPCAQYVLSRSIWKNRMNSTVSSKLTEAKQLARQGIEQKSAAQTDATTFAFASLSQSFFYA